MNKSLYNYLEQMFYRDNHPKYRKYFKEWVDNLTPEQIEGAEFWKYCEESGNLKK